MKTQHYIDKFVLPEHPQKYSQQHNKRYCGLFTLKAVVESLANIKQSIHKYGKSFLSKNF